MKTLHIPLWQRRRLGNEKRNYIREGYEQMGVWQSLDEDVKELILKANYI
jgi:hypothetical protein